MIIKEYRMNNDIDIHFPEYDCIVKNRQYKDFKEGTVKCPYEKRYYNKGYLGEGKYKILENGKLTKCYKTWNHMLERCFDEKLQIKRPTYKGCKVCAEWLNFQVFAEWFYNNYYEVGNEKMCIDKDILVKGNKIYSPETCVFVPHNINVLFVKNNKNRGDLPIGVSKDKNKFRVRLNKCCTGKKEYVYLGAFYDEIEAFNVYKMAKEQYIKEVADYYKDKIPQRLYDAMYNYEVEITD
mgnify:CR=1 FL=1